MEKKETGGPAFPCDRILTGEGTVASGTGMTMRDYFASKAMEAIVCDPHYDTGDMGGYDNIATCAYSLADAMLKARAA